VTELKYFYQQVVCSPSSDVCAAFIVIFSRCAAVAACINQLAPSVSLCCVALRCVGGVARCVNGQTIARRKGFVVSA